MKKVLILHGWEGSPKECWQSWLAEELLYANCIVAYPELLNKSNPVKNEWLDQVSTLLVQFQPDIVICHSLANILWFHLCNEHRISSYIEKLFLVAVPHDARGEEAIASFFPYKTPQKLFSNTVTCIASDNDPYCSVTEAKVLANALHINLMLLKDAGHINEKSGFGPWPYIRDLVLS